MLTGESGLRNLFGGSKLRFDRGAILVADALNNLLTYDFRLVGGLDPQTNLTALDLDDNDSNFSVDGNAFAQFAGQYEHHRSYRQNGMRI